MKYTESSQDATGWTWKQLTDLFPEISRGAVGG